MSLLSSEFFVELSEKAVYWYNRKTFLIYLRVRLNYIKFIFCKYLFISLYGKHHISNKMFWKYYDVGIIKVVQRNISKIIISLIQLS